MSSVIAANSWNSRNSSREHNISQHHTDTDTDSTDSTFFTRSLLKNGKGRSKVVVEGPFEDILKVYRCYLLCCVRHDRWDFHTANNHHRTEVGRRLRCSNTVTLMSCWGQTEPVLCSHENSMEHSRNFYERIYTEISRDLGVLQIRNSEVVSNSSALPIGSFQLAVLSWIVKFYWKLLNNVQCCQLKYVCFTVLIYDGFAFVHSSVYVSAVKSNIMKAYGN